MKTREMAEHPSSGELLLHLAHELPERKERELTQHLAACWTCAARAESLKQGIQAFVEARDVSHERIAVPSPRVHALRQRLESTQRESVWSWLSAWIYKRSRPLLPSRRLGIAAGVMAPVLAVLFLVTRPPDLSASDLLRKATLSVQADRGTQKRKVYRRIRIWSGAESVDWNSEAGIAPNYPESAASREHWSRALRGPVNWEDPLSVADFQRWRDAQAHVHDEISESSGYVVLTTTGRNSAGILRASLTLRRRDWHAIAKMVYVDGQPPIEVKEIAWELRDPSAPRISPRAPTRTLPESVSARPAPVAAVPMHVDTGLAELRARLVLFSAGVGLTGEEPGFAAHVTANGVHIEVATSSEARKVRLRELLERIPGVGAQITGPDHAFTARMPGEAAAQKRLSQIARGQHTRPLLWKDLVEKLGSSDAASQYCIRLLDAAAKTRAIVAQIHELSIRYPPASVATLNLEAQRELTSLQQNMLSSLAEASAEYAQALAPVFAAGSCNSSGQPGTNDERRVHELFLLVSERDRVMAKLFATTTADADTSIAPEELVHQFNLLNLQICALVRQK